MILLESTIAAILRPMNGINKSRRDFFTHTIILFLSIQSRLNFLNLARHSNEYSELTFRLQFEQFFDFASFNAELIKTHGSGHFVIGFDPSYIRKSGKFTPNTGKFWSGCLRRAEWGLEASCLSVIDMDNHTAFHFDAIISPNNAECKLKEITLVDHYLSCILWSAEKLEAFSRYLCVDAYFAKKEFICPILDRTNLEIICRLRDDADLRYLPDVPLIKGKGRPRIYGDKINIKNPDFTKFTLVYEDNEVKIYDIVVYCKFLKRKIRLAYTQWTDEKGKKSVKLYFSTELSLCAWMILKYYQIRFQQEFVFRDGKQFNGLQHCQARSANKIEFHWNCALTAVNVAKVQYFLSVPIEKRKSFSMANVKTRCHNQLLIDRFFEIYRKNPDLSKNNPEIKELVEFGCIAA
jgi:hypothetical protein